ncbi:3-prime end of extracellular mutant protein [Scheffersomyces xylosifermentans]|uniref:3-prime end of extracellular mutant protein n=1 Tax=Scheffersomyces xylosifermentans TaxID=1304137 RepID=UPI00315C9535
MQFKTIFTTSALAGIALAANNSTLTTATPSVTKDCSFSDFTATNSAQVQQVAACQTAVGDITIYGDAFGSIELTGVEQIFGSLHVKNATQAVTLNAPTLQLVSGTLELNANTILQNLNLAQLTTVGSLNFNALPALEQTGLTAGITSADSIVIADTGLTSLSGINVYELKTFDVNNNQDIDTIDSGLQSVTDSLSISYNAEKVDVILDQLTSANNVFLQSINSLSANNLTTVNGSLAVSSSSVDEVQFKGLTNIGKSLTINKNDNLETLDFPKLTNIGGALQISDNEHLRSFDGFPELKTIGGSVDINGTFDNGTFESLQRVAGGFNLKSEGDVSCDEFKKLNSDGDIKGNKFVCSNADGASSSSSSKKGSSDSTDSSDSSETGSSETTSTKAKSSSKDSGAASHTGKLGAIVAGFAIFGVALY